MTKAVVAFAFFRSAEHLVSLGNLLELLFRGGVTLVAVGVILHGKLAVGFFDIFRRCLAADP